MSMIGNYLAVDPDMLNEITKGNKRVHAITPEECSRMDIDKSWQAIYHVMCKCMDQGKSPCGFIVPLMKDHCIECGDETDIFYIKNKEVKEAYKEMEPFDEESFRALYDITSLVDNQMYPVLKGENEENFFHYLFKNFKAIRSFYKTAAEKGEDVIFYVS